MHDRAGQRDPLPLAAGELLRLAPGHLLQPDLLQDLADSRRDLGSLQLLPLQAVGDVLRHGHVREQRVGLEHEVDRPAVRGLAEQVLAVQRDGALVGELEAGQDSQECRLAAAAGTEQREELALPDLQDDLRQGLTSPKRRLTPVICEHQDRDSVSRDHRAAPRSPR